jgi:hypothetical protein
MAARPRNDGDPFLSLDENIVFASGLGLLLFSFRYSTTTVALGKVWLAGDKTQTRSNPPGRKRAMRVYGQAIAASPLRHGGKPVAVVGSEN